MKKNPKQKQRAVGIASQPQHYEAFSYAEVLLRRHWQPPRLSIILSVLACLAVSQVAESQTANTAYGDGQACDASSR